ncbi:hypothetical protein AB0J38_23415 [Streptomyces sp. NPDC050095]|uniref:VG15 protein n=1 Tax=unclassified Streptomyces TaxID=2593676 RepID=UPI00341FD344
MPNASSPQAYKAATARYGVEAARAVGKEFKSATALGLISDPATWLRRFHRALLPWRRKAHGLAGDFYNAQRAAQKGLGPITWPKPDPEDEWRKSANSFMKLGPNRINQEIAKRPSADLNDPDFVRHLNEVMDKAVKSLEADAARLAANGGREALHKAVQDDTDAIAWYRRLDGANPCAFCIMLASRGAVYKTKQKAQYGWNGEEYHRNCHCVPVPIFSRKYKLPESSERARRAWKNGEIEIKETRNGTMRPVFKEAKTDD